MTRDEAAKIIRTLRTGGYRTPIIDDEFVTEWHRAMASFDFTVAQQAAWTWIDNEGAWPTMNQWLDRLQATARGRAAERAQLALPPTRQDRKRSAEVIRTLRAVMAEGAKGEGIAQEAKLRLHEKGIDLPTTATSGAKCPDCGDSTLIETKRDDGATGFRPCPRCNPVGAVRWAQGHHDPDHTCGECDAIRGRKIRKREAAPA